MDLRHNLRLVAFGAGCVAATVLIPMFMDGHGGSPDTIRDIKGYILALWTIGLPLWFLAEYAKYRYSTAEAFEQFKYAQSLAKDLWIGISATLVVLWQIPKIG